jgi:hypothetical protein
MMLYHANGSGQERITQNNIQAKSAETNVTLNLQINHLTPQTLLKW